MNCDVGEVTESLENELYFECAINPENLIKTVGAIFEKMKIFFFLYELPLIFRVDRKRKSKLEIFARRL